jgi:hypothetical protein
VLSKTGELLGIMVNESTCVLITNFLPQNSLTLGDNLMKTPTGPVLDEIAARYRALRLRM